MLKFFTIATLILSAVEAAQDIPLIQDEQRSTPRLVIPLIQDEQRSIPRLVEYKQTKTRHEFTLDEDEVISEWVRRKSNVNWLELASYLSKENHCAISARQVRDRYRLYLSPSLTRPWSNAEDEQLMKLLDDYGNNYEKIALYFPSRDQNSVKNRAQILSGESNGSFSKYLDKLTNGETRRRAVEKTERMLNSLSTIAAELTTIATELTRTGNLIRIGRVF